MPNEFHLIRLIHGFTRGPCPGERVWVCSMEQAIVTGKPPVTDHDVQAGIGPELGLAAETGRLCDEAWGSFQRNRRYGAGRSAIVPGKGKKTQNCWIFLVC